MPGFPLQRVKRRSTASLWTYLQADPARSESDPPPVLLSAFARNCTSWETASAEWPQAVRRQIWNKKRLSWLVAATMVLFGLGELQNAKVPAASLWNAVKVECRFVRCCSRCSWRSERVVRDARVVDSRYISFWFDTLTKFTHLDREWWTTLFRVLALLRQGLLWPVSVVAYLYLCCAAEHATSRGRTDT